MILHRQEREELWQAVVKRMANFWLHSDLAELVLRLMMSMRDRLRSQQSPCSRVPMDNLRTYPEFLSWSERWFQKVGLFQVEMQGSNLRNSTSARERRRRRRQTIAF